MSDDDKVRMTHPTLEGQPYLADPQQVPHLRSAGWVVDPGQPAQGEEWPADLQRFDGQEQVWLRHPDLDEPIRVAASAVSVHEQSGWVPVEGQPDALDGLTVAELKERARAAGVAVSGTKEELLERLRSEPTDEQQPEQPEQPDPGADPAAEQDQQQDEQAEATAAQAPSDNEE